MKTLRDICSLAFMLAIIAGCERSNDSTGTVVTGTAHAADDVVIAYDVRGRGDITPVFIHGWACDRSFWREQLDVFASDYRVVGLDLGGHGDSQADRDVWSIAILGGDVQAVVRELNLKEVVLIGHSLGGVVALEAAHLMPEQVMGIVGVDALHDAEEQYTEEIVRQVADDFKANFKETTSTFVRQMFPEDTDPALVEWVISKACSANQQFILAIILETPNLNIKKRFMAAKVPIHCINAAPFPPMNTETKIETNRKYADFDVVMMKGVGHFPMLERPAEFNMHLRKILSEMISQ